MSRHPSPGTGRFDQQFSESESERNERLRRKRSDDDLDSMHRKENEISRLMTENIRLRRALDQISREGECVYARRLALNALAR